MYKTIEKHTESCRRYIPIIGGDFNAELGLGHGNYCSSVGRYTQRGKQKRRLDEILDDATRLHSPQKQTTFISPKDNEKQIDYILTKRRYLRHMIHMGSGHGCVMATFAIHIENTRKQEDTIEYDELDQAEKTLKP